MAVLSKDNVSSRRNPLVIGKPLLLRGALRLKGMTAPMVLDGPMDGAAFRIYVSKFLAPTLKKGYSVIIDNLPSHGVTGIKEAIAAVCAKLHFLPPYSPDLNPIEQAFSNIKSELHSRAARAVDALYEAIDQIMTTISPREYAAYLANSGYST